MAKLNGYKLNGYIVVRVPDHPHSFSWGNNGTGWVYEHRYVIEQFLGRFLTEDEVVHHKDGNRSNNDITNLEILTQSEHSILHQVERFGPKSLCKVCGGLCSKRTEAVRKQLYCSPECSAIGLRRVKRPDKETLEKDIQDMSWLALGRKYGVSDNAVRKWARSYSLI